MNKVKPMKQNFPFLGCSILKMPLRYSVEQEVSGSLLTLYLADILDSNQSIFGQYYANKELLDH